MSTRSGKYKMILVGDTAVGKTTLIHSLKGLDPQHMNQASTIGASFSSLKVGNHIIDSWDTAGQERYFSLVDMYFRNVDIAFFVYDVTELSTLESIFEKWYPRYLDCRQKYNDTQRNTLVFLIGNKADKNEQKIAPNITQYLQSKDQYILQNKMHQFTVSAWTKRNLPILRKELEEQLGITIHNRREEEERKQKLYDEEIRTILERKGKLKSSCSGGSCF